MKTVEQIMELVSDYASEIADIASSESVFAHIGKSRYAYRDKTLAELCTAIEELHRDANRYNWLKDQHAYHYSMSLDSPAECGVEFQWQQGSYEERDWGLNDAIDNEIEREIDTAKEST